MEGVIREKTSKDIIIEYIIYFFIYAFLGWIMEVIYALFIHGHFVNRGFLFGPICPIYGFGAIILIMTTKKLYKRPVLKFIIATELRFLGSEIVYPQPHVGTRYWVATELAFFWSDFVGIRCIAI